MKRFWLALSIYCGAQVLNASFERMDSIVSDIAIILVSSALVLSVYLIDKKSMLNEQNSIAELMDIDNRTVIKMSVISLLLCICIIISEISLQGFFLSDYESSREIGIDKPGIIFAISLFYPIAEETIMRSILLKQLMRKRSFLAANTIQAIVFGLLHFDIYLFIFSFGFGLAMGIVTKYMNILYARLIHILNNSICSILLIIGLILPEFSPIGYLAVGIVFAAVTICLLYNIVRNGKVVVQSGEIG